MQESAHMILGYWVVEIAYLLKLCPSQMKNSELPDKTATL